jgi:hypothetical protein
VVTSATKAPAGWETFTAYNGAVQLGFDTWGKKTGVSHSYWLRDPTAPNERRMVPGVTGISGLLTEAAAGLSPWAAWCAVKYLKEKCKLDITDEQQDQAIKAHTQQRDKAAVRGTAVHQFVEALILGTPVPKEERNAAYKVAEAVVKTLRAQNIEILACEKRVYSRTHEYCGTMDLRARLSTGEVVILDLKTSKAFRSAHALQIASYALADAEEFPEFDYADAGVVLASTTPSIKMLSTAMKMPGREALSRCQNAFLGLLAVRTSIPNLHNFGQDAR